MKYFYACFTKTKYNHTPSKIKFLSFTKLTPQFQWIHFRSVSTRITAAELIGLTLVYVFTFLGFTAWRYPIFHWIRVRCVTAPIRFCSVIRQSPPAAF